MLVKNKKQSKSIKRHLKHFVMKRKSQSKRFSGFVLSQPKIARARTIESKIPPKTLPNFLIELEDDVGERS